MGIIGYDKNRDKVIFRQFHIEGFVNQYILSDSSQHNGKLVFHSEAIENFIERGKARWEIERINNDQVKSSFFLSFDGLT